MNCKKKKRLIKRILQQDPQEAVKRIYGAEDKTALTCGRISGRSNLAQQDLLAKLGVPRERSITWTKYKASQEITRRLTDTRKEPA